MGGAAAGALQLRGMRGVALYVLVMAIASFTILAKVDYQPSAYFSPKSYSTVFLYSALRRSVILPYLVVWIMFDAVASPLE